MEENKVALRDRLAKVIHSVSVDCNRWPCDLLGESCYARADAILQSPDLRVTLNEPKYHWIGKCVYLRTGEHTAKLIATCFDSELAQEYCDWLNSKEPK